MSGLYIGRDVDPATGTLGERTELEQTDLLTHGFIVGMTGSGKTGLAVTLIEEVLRRGIPVIAVDPKGDLGNLLLLFEGLSPQEFEPWVDPEAVGREQAGPGEAARVLAERWRAGLADWGLGAGDVAALRAAFDGVVFTPGSSAGIGLDVLESLSAPAVPFDSAEEDLRDEISDIASGLLSLVGIEADPLRSREHILIANLVEGAWREGRDLSVERLLAAIADPPFENLGALPVETVFPRKDRQELMMALNNLLASPSFEAWREGRPLSVPELLHAPDGRPRLSIVYTAHLSDRERLFVTALLLDKIKTWMRRQPGTGQLRALVYMDEIYGYFPPHPSNPPTKRPLLSLLKQARSQGVGVVLATQNPVDLDYKGLANMGTWLVGRLQTEQDRERLVHGLGGAGLERSKIGSLLDAVKKRVFLLHDVHRSAPSLVHSRWALSYLRGPLTRQEIGRLMAGRPGEPGAAGADAAPAPEATGPPPLPAPFEHHYLARYRGELADPHLLVRYAVRYKGLEEEIAVRAYPLAGITASAELVEGEPLEVDEAAVTKQAPAGIRYAALAEAVSALTDREIERVLRDRLPDKLGVTVWEHAATGRVSHPGETREAFVQRLKASGGGEDAGRLRDELEKKRRDLALKHQELSGRRTEKWVAVGSALLSNLGWLSGRKKRVTGASTVLTKNRLEGSAEARVAALQEEIRDLEAELSRVEAPSADSVEPRRLDPLRSGVKVLRYELVWVY